MSDLSNTTQLLRPELVLPRLGQPLTALDAHEVAGVDASVDAGFGVAPDVDLVIDVEVDVVGFGMGVGAGIRGGMCDECRRRLADTGCLDLWRVAVAAAEYRMASMTAHPSGKGGGCHEC